MFTHGLLKWVLGSECGPPACVTSPFLAEPLPQPDYTFQSINSAWDWIDSSVLKRALLLSQRTQDPHRAAHNYPELQFQGLQLPLALVGTRTHLPWASKLGMYAGTQRRMNRELPVVSSTVPVCALTPGAGRGVTDTLQENLTTLDFPPFIPRQSLAVRSRPASHCYTQVMPLPQPPKQLRLQQVPLHPTPQSLSKNGG